MDDLPSSITATISTVNSINHLSPKNLPIVKKYPQVLDIVSHKYLMNPKKTHRNTPYPSREPPKKYHLYITI